ncbi:MAG: exonuclease SbcCD subunit D [Solobacterium sp.]|nr:exonuclease SbcCD subunit D [Solobacterium sp.]
MKLFHTADLHLGKSVYGISMIDDQNHWIQQFLSICREERPDAVLIAGDVYDRASPGQEAVELLDLLLSSLSEEGIPVFMIAGNHDSGRKLSFASSLLAKEQVHITGTVQKELMHTVLKDPDGCGPVTVWMLPYTFPEQISRILEEEVRTYEEAFRRLLTVQQVDPTVRNIVLVHQNITQNGMEAERGGSETSVGGIGQIDFSVFDAFDYAALGHIHSAYPVGRETVRYAGTPLCYHFEETRQKTKGFTEVILKEKGIDPVVINRSIEPMHRMHYLPYSFEQVIQELENDTDTGGYYGIVLNDRRVTPEIRSHLSDLIALKEGRLLELTSSYRDEYSAADPSSLGTVQERPVEDLFTQLYTDINGGVSPDDDLQDVIDYVGELVRSRDAHEKIDPKDIDRILVFAAGKGERS